MTLGCIICAETFSTADPPEKHPLCIRICGHVFHSSCLKTWLAKSRTCPLCRSACSDSAAFFIRVHLQSVSNLDASFYDPALSVLKDSAKDKEIEDLRRQLADCRSTIDKIRSYYNDAQKLYRHIGIELGVSPQEDSIIDLSISPIILPPPAVLASSTITTRVASRVTASTRPTTASSHRPATTISSRVRQLASRGRTASSGSLLSSRTGS